MSVTVLSEYYCHDGKVDEFIRIAHEMFPAARRLAGCERIYLTISEDNKSHIIIISVWKRAQDHHFYLEGQTKNGNMVKIYQILKEHPRNTYLTNLDDF